MRSFLANIEPARRLIHLSMAGLPIAYLLGIITWNAVGVGIGILTVYAGVAEYLRLYHNLDTAVYDHLTRPYEKTAVAGYAMYALGMSLTWILFPTPVAIAGLLAVALGDPVSGVLSDTSVDETKQFLPITAMYIVCFVVIVIAIRPEHGLQLAGVAGLVGAVGAVLADVYKPQFHGRIIDDNLTIPLVTAATVFVVTIL